MTYWRLPLIAGTGTLRGLPSNGTFVAHVRGRLVHARPARAKSSS